MDRLQLSFFGPTNSGKSALVNALAGQEVSLVSPVPGTTTDAVRKLIELPDLGACVLVDTAGYDDDGTLGDERERLTRAYEIMKSELQTYENNIGFLSASSKKGNSLVAEIQKKADKLKDELDLLRQKIKAVEAEMRREATEQPKAE